MFTDSSFSMGKLSFKNEVNPDLEPSSDEEENKSPSSNETLNEYGELSLPKVKSNIHVITVVGQIEGHLVMPPQNKATKYEHIIPQLVAIEQSKEIEGLIVILNTVGGDVEAGLAIAEMIGSLTKPTVSLVLGGGHSIGVPIAVSARTSFIAPTATMTIHPVRLTGMVIGVQQSFDYLERMQERVISFVTTHANITPEKFRELMMTTGELARDVGTIVVGQNAVDTGLIDRVGGLGDAIACLKEMISKDKSAKRTKVRTSKPKTSTTKAKRNDKKEGAKL